MGGSTTKPRSPQFKTKPFFFASEVAPLWPSRLVALFVAATRDAWSGVLICNSWLTGSPVSSGGVGWPWSHKGKRIHIWISKILSMDWLKGKSTGKSNGLFSLKFLWVSCKLSHPNSARIVWPLGRPEEVEIILENCSRSSPKNFWGDTPHWKAFQTLNLAMDLITPKNGCAMPNLGRSMVLMDLHIGMVLFETIRICTVYTYTHVYVYIYIFR